MKPLIFALIFAAAAHAADVNTRKEEGDAVKACAEAVVSGIRKVADVRTERFEGKVAEQTALCRGGYKAMQFRGTPWVDWSQYWGSGDMDSLPRNFLSTKIPSARGVTGALVDLEYQRMELIKFNLFDNSGTWRDYVSGRDNTPGPSLKVWPEMRLPRSNPFYSAVGGDAQQVCKGELVRGRTITGICNDVRNPLMGSSGTLMARNMEFETTFPDLGLTDFTRNRHGDRIGLMKPDPQVISRKLFTREQSNAAGCRGGFGTDCDYQKAPFFNVLAAYWIQFMTHDWFSHMDEGQNGPEYMEVGCRTQKVNGVETPLTPEQIVQLGCRPNDRIDKTLVDQTSAPSTFTGADGQQHMTRAPKTMRNNNTAWWDASQIYGYDENSRKRVQRDSADPAKLAMNSGLLPTLDPGAPALAQWRGQESAAFPDNWTIGMSFYHNLFSREHNNFVAEFRKQAALTPSGDSGLRNPANAAQIIRYRDVTPDELFEAARLVVSAEIAKIHTIEWTPQLLYDEPLYKGMNANWSGLLGDGAPEVSKVLSDYIVKGLGTSRDPKKNAQLYSLVASGPGIFGLGSKISHYDITNPQHLSGGQNHFGSPFNFPEEFITVYRLHPLLPDVIDFRDLRDPNRIAEKVPIIETFEAKSTAQMRSKGLADWGLSMGRQRLGLLTLHNHPAFMQNITIPRLDSETKQIDLAALDLIRDREHGVPRFNEFRRQYGLRQLTSFDDFTDKRLPADSPERKRQDQLAKELREVYGTHTCDASKVITDAQLDENGKPINDCLGHANGSTVDNIEDVDTVVGWLSESTRPHGFAISETQFVVFILNASRRLYSDRFFTSGFRPEFYTTLGLNWVINNGPAPLMEQGMPNGHRQPVSPLKRVLLRNIPELAPELKTVINVFDPWARDRGQYYTLDWKPRPGAESDPAFRQ